MLLIHIVFLFLFIIAAMVISVYGLTLHIEGPNDSVNMEELVFYVKLCIMNSLVNLVTSSFAIYLLYTISESNNVKQKSNANSKQTIADLAWVRNQEAIRQAKNHEESVRKIAAYNANARAMEKLYIDRLLHDSDIDSVLSSRQNSHNPVKLDQQIVMLFTADS